MTKDFNTYPLVSIITINYNQKKVTEELLKTLRNITYPNTEIIVVDNGSSSDSAETLKDNFPEITLIISDENLGFAGGNNLGIKISKGKYLMFINNDTEVPSEFLEPLVDLMENDKKIGMVSPKIKFYWNPEILQYAGITKMNPFTLRNIGLGYYKKDGKNFDNLIETESVHGAAMMVSREVIQQVGMMPEIYFLYYEEHDWAEMIKRKGYKILYQPASYILHKESVSTEKNSTLKTYYFTRNRLIFARRNFYGFPFLISFLFHTFISIPKNTIKYLIKGQVAHLKAYWQGVIWNLTHYKGIKNNLKL